MSARAVPDRADPWETRQPFKAECLECGIEWAWGYDWRKCEAAAEKHNVELHPAEHGPDWSDWGIDHPEEGPSCKCGFNGSPEECAGVRSTDTTEGGGHERR